MRYPVPQTWHQKVEIGRERREGGKRSKAYPGKKSFTLLCSYDFNIPQTGQNSHTMYAKHKCRSSSYQTVVQTLATQVILVLYKLLEH